MGNKEECDVSVTSTFLEDGKKEYLQVPLELIKRCSQIASLPHICGTEKKITGWLNEKKISSNRFFSECWSVIEVPAIKQKEYYTRILNYIKVGFILPSREIFCISKPLVSLSTVDSIFEEVLELYNKAVLPTSNVNMVAGNKFSIVFMPQPAAYITHEVFGHCFEKDYYECFFQHKHPKGSKYANELVNIDEYSQWRGSFEKKQDDVGNILPDRVSIINKGYVENTINGYYENDKTGQLMNRMCCTVLTGSECKTVIPRMEKYIKIYSVSNAFVNFKTEEVFIIANLAEIVIGDTRRYCHNLLLKANIAILANDICWISDNVSIYQNYCIKDGSVIEVLAGAPSIMIDNIDILGDSL